MGKLRCRVRGDVVLHVPQLSSVALDEQQRSAVQRSVNEAFVSGFRVVVIEAAVLALVAAGFGAGIREKIQR
ncbi:MAG: hypothetical protein ABI408_13620 [Gemmatimonadaceae bacterium]